MQLGEMSDTTEKERKEGGEKREAVRVKTTEKYKRQSNGDEKEVTNKRGNV